MRNFNSTPRAGFSLLEIVIAISVLAIIAGAMTLRSGSLIDKGRVSNALDTIDVLKKASVMFNTDTGTFAREYAGYPASSRQLSGTQSSNGWSGPYIESPLPVNANPWGGTIHLYNTVTANGWVPGFDIDGDGTTDVTGDGNMIYFAEVEASAAKKINDTIDKAIGGTWEESGRVRYVTGSKILLVLVHW